MQIASANQPHSHCLQLNKPLWPRNHNVVIILQNTKSIYLGKFFNPIFNLFPEKTKPPFSPEDSTPIPPKIKKKWAKIKTNYRVPGLDEDLIMMQQNQSTN